VMVAEAMTVVMVVVLVIMVVIMVVLVMLAHASIPVAGSAMCSNMVESRLLMCASAAA
jgi:preprotein translocase subunit SecG